MLNTHESVTQVDDSSENDILKDLGFAKVCIEICTKFNIDMKDVIKTLKEVYTKVMERKKRSQKKIGIQAIKCDLVFRKLESPRDEDVLLVFGPHQLVILDVIPYIRVNPVNGERTKTAVLRICPGSFGKFSDKKTDEIGASMKNVVATVSRVMDKNEQSDSSIDADGMNC